MYQVGFPHPLSWCRNSSREPTVLWSCLSLWIGICWCQQTQQPKKLFFPYCWDHHSVDSGRGGAFCLPACDAKRKPFVHPQQRQWQSRKLWNTDYCCWQVSHKGGLCWKDTGWDLTSLSVPTATVGRWSHLVKGALEGAELSWAKISLEVNCIVIAGAEIWVCVGSRDTASPQSHHWEISASWAPAMGLKTQLWNW